MKPTFKLLRRGIILAAAAFFFTCAAHAHDDTFKQVLECPGLLGAYGKSVNLKIHASSTHGTFRVDLPGFTARAIPTTTYEFQMILDGLRMSVEEFRDAFKDKHILLIGEGFGTLLPELVALGAKVKAVDPLYALADIPESDWEMASIDPQADIHGEIKHFRNFLKDYQRYLVPGTSFALPFANGTFDFVISHMFYNNLLPAQYEVEELTLAISNIQRSALESVRVLNKSGAALNVIKADGILTADLIHDALSELLGKDQTSYPRMSYALSEAHQVLPRFSGRGRVARELNSNPNRAHYSMRVLVVAHEDPRF